MNKRLILLFEKGFKTVALRKKECEKRGARKSKWV